MNIFYLKNRRYENQLCKSNLTDSLWYFYGNPASRGKLKRVLDFYFYPNCKEKLEETQIYGREASFYGLLCTSTALRPLCKGLLRQSEFDGSLSVTFRLLFAFMTFKLMII